MISVKIKRCAGAALAAGAVLYCVYLFLPHPTPRNVPRLVAGMEIFSDGQTKENAEQLENALRIFEQACETDSRSYEAWHMRCVTEFHLLLLNRGRSGRPAEEETGKYSSAVEHSALKVTSLQSKFAEPYALLAAVTGMRAAKRGSAAAVRRYDSLALMLGSDNPRVHYLTGIRYHLGRGRQHNEDKAEEMFLKASELFEREPPGARPFNFPSWGHDRCLMYLGDIQLGRGDRKKAAGFYRRALAVNPFLKPAREALKKLSD
ncbi:MAG: tetratricopeptide repeat protein [Kiritimatiellia bacterium]